MFHKWFREWKGGSLRIKHGDDYDGRGLGVVVLTGSDTSQ